MPTKKPKKPKHPRLEFYVSQSTRSLAAEHRWRVRATNGKIVADSAEGYKRRHACVRGAYAALDALTVGLVALESEAGK